MGDSRRKGKKKGQVILFWMSKTNNNKTAKMKNRRTIRTMGTKRMNRKNSRKMEIKMRSKRLILS